MVFQEDGAGFGQSVVQFGRSILKSNIYIFPAKYVHMYIYMYIYMHVCVYMYLFV